MKNITELIRARRSVRTFDGKPLDGAAREQLTAFMSEAANPFGIPVTFRFLDAGEHGLICPVVTGADLYIGGKVRCIPFASAAFGYSFEALVLYAQSLGLGTVWLGGTMNRPAFEAAMALADDEMMPCASPVGRPATRMSMREMMMRKAVKADERLPFEELFFHGNFDHPLTKEAAGNLGNALEMVRLAPSAVNKQPWRAVLDGDSVHFYLKRSKGFGHDAQLDLQMTDIGIALCHFALTAEAEGLRLAFAQKNPGLTAEAGLEYIATYTRSGAL